jgi:hypothetical protein
MNATLSLVNNSFLTRIGFLSLNRLHVFLNDFYWVEKLLEIDKFDYYAD